MEFLELFCFLLVYSYVISKLEFERMGFQVGLFLQIGLIVLPDVMADENDGHDQRNELTAVFIYNLKNLLLFRGIEILLEVSEHMHENIGVFLGGCL